MSLVQRRLLSRAVGRALVRRRPARAETSSRASSTARASRSSSASSPSPSECRSGSCSARCPGFFGGKTDSVIMRLMDIMLSIPGLLMAIGIAAMLGPGLFSIMIAIGVVNVPIFARLLRGSVLGQKGNDFVLAARAIGVPRRTILVSHILPNAISPIIVAATLALATAIIDAAGLGFLGLGPQDPSTPEWGTMLTDTVQVPPDGAAPRDHPGHRDRRSPCSASTSSATVCARRSTRSSEVADRARATSLGRGSARRVLDEPRHRLRRQRHLVRGRSRGDARHRRRVGLREERDLARAARHPLARRTGHGRVGDLRRSGSA